jgi:hypothetical protein
VATLKVVLLKHPHSFKEEGARGETLHKSCNKLRSVGLRRHGRSREGRIEHWNGEKSADDRGSANSFSFSSKAKSKQS